MVRERVLSILTDLDKYKAEFMADKMGLVATLHSLLGNAYLELNDLDLALKHHPVSYTHLTLPTSSYV